MMPSSTLSLLTRGLETVLNRLLYRDRSLKPARQRLTGKVLILRLRDFPQPLVIQFDTDHLTVLSDWDGEGDCTLSTRLSTLPKLRYRQQLTAFIRSGELEVAGDIQVVQHFSTLLDLAEYDPAEYLADWLGDLPAYGLTRTASRLMTHFRHVAGQAPEQVVGRMTEAWRLLPAALELSWFSDEVQAVEQSLATLTARLTQLETT